MKKEFRPIIYLITIIGSFYIFLLYGSLSFLALSLIFLPVVLVELYGLKKLSFNVFLSGLLGVLIIQIIGVLYVYLNKYSYLTSSNDYFSYYGILASLVITLWFIIYFYYKGDVLNKITQ